MRWKQLPIGLPKRFRGKVPLFQVIKACYIERGGERIEVRRAFSDCQESTRVIYAGPALEETITMLEGRITDVQNQYPVPEDIFHENMTRKQLFDAITLVFNPRKPDTLTYHNIKRFEPELKELPWQEDLNAIYIGNGIYTPV